MSVSFVKRKMDKLSNNLIHINLCEAVVFIVLKLAWWWLHMNFKNFRYIIIPSRLIIFILHHIKFQCLNNAYMLPFFIPLLTGHFWTWLYDYFFPQQEEQGGMTRSPCNLVRSAQSFFFVCFIFSFTCEVTTKKQDLDKTTLIWFE